MALPSYTNTEERDCSAYLEIFTKGTKRGRWRRKSTHSAAATTGVFGRGERRRPPGRVHLAKERGLPTAKGQIGNCTTPEGARGSRAAPGLTPKAEPLVPRGRQAQSWAGGGGVRDLSRIRVPRKLRKDLSRAVPGSARSCHPRRGAEGGVMGGADRPLQNPSRVRGPSRRVLHPAQARPQHTRGAILLFRPPPEIWGCAPGRAGCRGGGASHLIRGRELQLIDIEGRHQGDGVEAILQQRLLGALLREIVPQLHHGSGRPEAASLRSEGRAGVTASRTHPLSRASASSPAPRLVSGEGS